MQEFLAHQNELKLNDSEILIDYIYVKDALLEKAPFIIPQLDHISRIMVPLQKKSGRFDLATQNSITVEELIDKATALDAMRNQPFYENALKRVDVDFFRTINLITKINPHPIDRIEYVIKRITGKRYNSKMDIKSAFNTIRVKDTNIYKTGFVAPSGHFEFLRMPSGIRNGSSTMIRVIKLAYNHLEPHNVEFSLERPNPERTTSIKRYSTLKSIQEVRSFLGIANQFRKHIRNHALIVKPLTNSLK
ncbi:retrovirus-related Pol polyprotein from transposon opus [Nephila pilipes]|uniref:Retrovirus-related Pol polyprotein from transposon opus n=1 Tax=Nephila pilipes TaxID=299642 RepID=A0A8X6UL68_NEPPI|nr:retrovirus-related Pol polyprotein from transposon opus [Nephila pilipes]